MRLRQVQAYDSQYMYQAARYWRDQEWGEPVLCVASGAGRSHASALHAEAGLFMTHKRGTWGISCWGPVLTLSRQAGARREDERGRRPPPKVSLTLVSFSTTRKAYERITARFAREYQAATGQPVRFRLSFGGSGTQARPARSPT